MTDMVKSFNNPYTHQRNALINQPQENKKGQEIRFVKNFLHAFSSDEDFLEQLSQATQPQKVGEESFLFWPIDKMEDQVSAPLDKIQLQDLLFKIGIADLESPSFQKNYMSFFQDRNHRNIRGTVGVLCFMFMEACRHEGLPNCASVFESLGDKLTHHKEDFGMVPRSFTKMNCDDAALNLPCLPWEYKDKFKKKVHDVWEKAGRSFVADKIRALPDIFGQDLDHQTTEKILNRIESFPEIDF